MEEARPITPAELDQFRGGVLPPAFIQHINDLLKGGYAREEGKTFILSRDVMLTYRGPLPFNWAEKLCAVFEETGKWSMKTRAGFMDLIFERLE